MKSSAEVIELESVDAATPKLGEMLLADQKLTRNDLDRALEVQRSMGGRLGRFLCLAGRFLGLLVQFCLTPRRYFLDLGLNLALG